MKTNTKALVNKMFKCSTGSTFNEYDVGFDDYWTSIRCSIVCIDEQIKLIQSLKHPMNTALSNRRLDRKVDELLEVKQELEKL